MPEISVLSLPAMLARGRWRLETPHAIAAHRFYWITRGQGRISIGGLTRGFSQNTVLFVPASRVHGLVAGLTLQGYAVTLPDHLAVPVPGNPARIRAASIFEQARISGYLEQIAAEFTAGGAGSGDAMESYLTLLSVWIERKQAQNDWQSGRPETAATRLVAGFLQWIETALGAKPTVGAAARALGVTPTHLTRVCRTHIGQSASAIIRARVIYEASVQLADTTARIGEIGASLGFATPAYFSRVFQSIRGQSPRDFRQ